MMIHTLDAWKFDLLPLYSNSFYYSQIFQTFLSRINKTTYYSDCKQTIADSVQTNTWITIFPMLNELLTVKFIPSLISSTCATFNRLLAVIHIHINGNLQIRKRINLSIELEDRQKYYRLNAIAMKNKPDLIFIIGKFTRKNLVKSNGWYYLLRLVRFHTSFYYVAKKRFVKVSGVVGNWNPQLPGTSPFQSLLLPLELVSFTVTVAPFVHKTKEESKTRLKGRAQLLLSLLRQRVALPLLIETLNIQLFYKSYRSNC